MLECRICKRPVLPVKRQEFTDLCIICGAYEARNTRHTVVPMHKSNYTVVTNRADLIGINNKGGNVK